MTDTAGGENWLYCVIFKLKFMQLETKTCR